MQVRGSGGEPLSVGRRAEPVIGPEAAREVVLVRPAHGSPDGGDGLIGVEQQDGGMLGAKLGKVGHGGKSGGGLEHPHQMAGGEVGFGGQLSQRPPAGDVGLQHAQHAPDGGMRRRSLMGQYSMGARHGASEMAEQQ